MIGKSTEKGKNGNEKKGKMGKKCQLRAYISTNSSGSHSSLSPCTSLGTS